MRRGVRRVALVLSAMSGLASAVLFVQPVAHADDGPGADLASVSLAADAGGQRIVADTLAGQSPGTVDSGVPDAEVTLTLSTAHAFSSVAWPSDLAGNLGALLALLGPNPCTPGDVGPVPLPIPITCSPVSIPQPVQDQYHLLNDPVRAEAQYPTAPSQDASVPGATMSARTTSTGADAQALVGAAVVSDVESFGSVRASATGVLTDARTGVSDAHSTISDISLGSGLITIGSVATTAHAQTDGASATSNGSTTVQDMKVAGVPVYVDATGVHAGSAGAPVDAATAAVQQALSGAGFTITLTKPTVTNRRGTASYSAASLVITWNQGASFVFGGAHATAGASLPYQPDLSAFPTVGPPPTPNVVAPPPTGAEPPVGTAALPEQTVPGAVYAPAVTAPAVAGPALSSASAAVTLPGGISAAWVLAGLAIVGLLATGLRRLPDHVLGEPGARCPLEENP